MNYFILKIKFPNLVSIARQYLNKNYSGMDQTRTHAKLT